MIVALNLNCKEIKIKKEQGEPTNDQTHGETFDLLKKQKCVIAFGVLGKADKQKNVVHSARNPERRL